MMVAQSKMLIEGLSWQMELSLRRLEMIKSLSACHQALAQRTQASTDSEYSRRIGLSN